MILMDFYQFLVKMSLRASCSVLAYFICFTTNYTSCLIFLIFELFAVTSPHIFLLRMGWIISKSKSREASRRPTFLYLKSKIIFSDLCILRLRKVRRFKKITQGLFFLDRVSNYLLLFLEINSAISCSLTGNGIGNISLMIVYFCRLSIQKPFFVFIVKFACLLSAGSNSHLQSLVTLYIFLISKSYCSFLSLYGIITLGRPIPRLKKKYRTIIFREFSSKYPSSRSPFWYAQYSIHPHVSSNLMSPILFFEQNSNKGFKHRSLSRHSGWGCLNPFSSGLQSRFRILYESFSSAVWIVTKIYSSSLGLRGGCIRIILAVSLYFLEIFSLSLNKSTFFMNIMVVERKYKLQVG